MEEEREGFFENANLKFLPDLSRRNYTNLNFNHNEIHAISSEYLPQTCKVFSISHNNLTSDGLPIEWPNPITKVSLAYNSIQTTEETEWPVGLKELNLESNPLRSWPERLPESLEILIVNCTKIETVEQLPSRFRRLDAFCCKIKQLPTSLPDSVEALFLYHNLLRNSRLPFVWGSNLRKLDLTRNALTKVPENLPDSLESLYLDQNKITEIPEDLPANLVLFVIESNRIRKVSLKPRRRPLEFFSVANNQLPISVQDLQEEKGILFSNCIREEGNWYGSEFENSAKKIQKFWNVYRIKKTLRVFLKTARLKEELQQVSMHPCRAGRYENISQEWGWGC